MADTTENKVNDENLQDDSWEAILSNPENIATAKEIQAELQAAYDNGLLPEPEIIETK